MNYTENYHLPQWDETDRILRVDFNQMCANIEEGLNQNAAGATEANTKTAADAAAAVRAAEKKALDQAYRLAYNHYCFAQTLTPFPRQLGVFHQDTSVDDMGFSGLVKYRDYYEMNYAPAKDYTQMLELLEQTEMSASGSADPQALTATFTAPSNGLIQGFKLQVQFQDVANSSFVFPCAVTYKDLTENRTILTSSFTLTVHGPDGTLTHPISEPLYISCGHRYQVTVAPNLTNTLPGYGSSLSGRFVLVSFTSGATGATAAIGHTIQDPGENLGLLVVASYQFTANCATPKLLVDGQEIPLWWSRTVEDGKGNSIREVVFRRDGTVENGETVELQLFCGWNETLTLYSWGVVLI